VQDMVTAEALAHLFGVSAKTIRALARRGIVVKAGRNLFTLADSVQHYCGHLRDLAHGRKDGDAAPTERARLAAAQADAIELKNARARGALVDSEAVTREWEGICRTLRIGMLRVPKRAAARLPHLTPQDVRAIDCEVRAALTVLGDKI
jgi:phage terminase Nu1 subunit (DNA packaging protein)